MEKTDEDKNKTYDLILYHHFCSGIPDECRTVWISEDPDKGNQ